jgi:hypothetical protein
MSFDKLLAKKGGWVQRTRCDVNLIYAVLFYNFVLMTPKKLGQLYAECVFCLSSYVSCELLY